jgi:hypothetical protein
LRIGKKIFDSFDENYETIPSNDKNFYAYEDPFDFFRRHIRKDAYLPMTQRGLRKAFAGGIIGIEFYLVMATSLRPLADEAQNVDEIAMLLSQQKLTRNPNQHSVKILRNLIKDPNPEIALYAAEGINSIENAFIEKIQKIRERIREGGKAKEKEYIQYYILGLLFLEFSKLLQDQKLIQRFYLKEAISALKSANNLRKTSKRILETAGDAYILLEQNEKALNIFTHLFSRDGKNRKLLMKLAECYYNKKDYLNVKTLASLAAKSSKESDDLSNLIIYQWILNT